MDNTLFYYVSEGQQQGPVSTQELLNLARYGKISGNTLIWRQGYAQWIPLKESELDLSFLPPPITPSKAVVTLPQIKTVQTEEFSMKNNSEPTQKNIFSNYYLGTLAKYATFSGRASRQEYWFFTLFNLLISFSLGLIDALLQTGEIFSSLYSLAVLLPSLAVACRRLHDIGRTGWWLLLALIPLLGWIILIIFHCLDSEAGTNQYGENPKGL